MADEKKPRIRLKAGAYPRIASRVFDTPLMIHEGKLNAILSVLGPRLGFTSPILADADPYEARYVDDGLRISGNVAMIDVIGTLVHHYDLISEASGFCSYETLDQNLKQVGEDDTIKFVALRIDTPGGEISGLYPLAEKIYQLRQKKTVVAILDDMAASAGYLIASACSEIVIPEAGQAGSIGVVTAHCDRSGQLEQLGIAVTWLYKGDKKVDGNSTEPLSDTARADIMDQLDKLYNQFTQTVARNRGISVQEVVATQAGMFLGQDAIDAGLADRIGSFNDEIVALGARQDEPLRPIVTEEEDDDMGDTTKPGGAAPTAEEIAAQATAARTEGKSEGVKEGQAAGATAAKERFKAIMGLDEAKDRQTQAQHIALETDMTAEQAKSLLAVSPKEKVEAAAPVVPAKGTTLAEAMAKENGGKANVGEEVPGEGKGEGVAAEVQQHAASILAFIPGAKKAANK